MDFLGLLRLDASSCVLPCVCGRPAEVQPRPDARGFLLSNHDGTCGGCPLHIIYVTGIASCPESCHSIIPFPLYSWRFLDTAAGYSQLDRILSCRAIMHLTAR